MVWKLKQPTCMTFSLQAVDHYRKKHKSFDPIKKERVCELMGAAKEYNLYYFCKEDSDRIYHCQNLKKAK